MGGGATPADRADVGRLKLGPSRRVGADITAPVEGLGGVASISVRVPEHTATDDAADWLVAVGLLVAMRRGLDLHVDGQVSPRLLSGVGRFQTIYRTWDRHKNVDGELFRTARVTTRTTAAPEHRTGGTVAFFTGGVDSFHTAISHRDEIDALVYVHGFDVPLDRTWLRTRVRARLRAAADELGLPLVEVETDLRVLGDRAGLDWLDHHGSSLAAIGLLLAPIASRVLIPATHTYAELRPLGSHPMLDPLWSTEHTEIVHVGADVDRLTKIRTVADHPAARTHLRVCWENLDDAYNCGRCEKCVRTGVAVRLAGAEGRFTSLPAPSLARVAGVDVPGHGGHWQRYRDQLVREGTNPRLRRAIDVALARHRWATPSLRRGRR